MSQFTATMYCERCHKETAHRVYFIHLWGNPPDMYVQILHRCIRITAVTGRGRNRKSFICGRERESMLHVRDYNALVKMAKSDFGNDFNSEDTDVPKQLNP